MTYDHPDGRERILSVSEAPLDDADGALDGSLAMVSDITDARRLEDELRRAALHDTLTGLPNRALLLDRLQHALALQTRGTAVMFVDLDRFKIINDARGHAAGDELLIGVAARLRSAPGRPTPWPASAGTSSSSSARTSTSTTPAPWPRTCWRPSTSRSRWPDGEAMLSASIGVALSSSESADALLSHADTAMYAAKVAGRSRIRVFDAALAAQAEERFELGSDLRRALAGNELELHYQPVIDLASGQVLGAEALARWTTACTARCRRTGSWRSPRTSGLAARLDRWALRRAAHDTAALRRGLRPARRRLRRGERLGPDASATPASRTGSPGTSRRPGSPPPTS